MVTQAQRAMLEAHIEAERRQDLDAILVTLSAQPSYVIPNYVVTGREALRAMYQRSMSALTPENADEYLRALEDPRVATWGDNHIVLQYSDDYPLHAGMAVVIHFDGDHIRSEDTYYTSAGRFRPDPDDGFASLPGVRRLG